MAEQTALHTVLSDMVNCTEPLKCSWRKDAPARDCAVFCSACGSGFDAAMLHMAGRVARMMAERDGEREAREKIQDAYRKQDAAMGILFERLNKAGVDCSDLIP